MLTGSILGAVSSATTGWQPAARVAAKVGASAALARLQGGSFADAAWYSLKTNLALESFRGFVGWEPSLRSGQDQAPGVTYECGVIGSNCYVLGTDRGIPLAWKDTDVIGLNQPLNGVNDFFKQGGPLGRFLNQLPGLNAVAQLHDTIFNRWGWDLNLLTNVGTMLPAAFLTYGALVDSLPIDRRLCPRCQP